MTVAGPTALRAVGIGRRPRGPASDQPDRDILRVLGVLGGEKLLDGANLGVGF